MYEIQIDDGSSITNDFFTDTQNTKSLKLHNWQLKALEYFFFNDCKCLYQCVTASGKTIFGIELIKKVLLKDPNIKVLVVVPKNVILETGWFSELYNQGFNLMDIGVFYGNIKEYGKTITITNMQNLKNISYEIFDMVVFDEVHNYGTDSLLPFVMTEKKYKVGLSATMERLDKRHFNIFAAFDYNIFYYNADEALLDGVINPFNLTDISVEMDESSFERYTEISTKLNFIFKCYGSFRKIMTSKDSGIKGKMLYLMGERKDLVNNYCRKLDLLKVICQKHQDDKIIVFNEFNDFTNKIYWSLLDVGVKSCIFHSTMNEKKRQDNLTDYKNGKYQVLLTTRAVDEGYNLPKMDVGIICASNSTRRQTVQRMGRVLRKKDNSSELYQVFVGNTIEEQYAAEKTKFFKALCSNYHCKRFTLQGELIWLMPPFLFWQFWFW